MFTFCMLTSERFEFFLPDKLMFPVYTKDFSIEDFLILILIFQLTNLSKTEIFQQPQAGFS